MVLVDQRKRCWATHTRLHKLLACPAFDDLINAHYSKTLHKERHARHLVEQNQVERGDFVLHVEDDWHKVSGHKSNQAFLKQIPPVTAVFNASPSRMVLKRDGRIRRGVESQAANVRD